MKRNPIQTCYQHTTTCSECNALNSDCKTHTLTQSESAKGKYIVQSSTNKFTIFCTIFSNVYIHHRLSPHSFHQLVLTESLSNDFFNIFIAHWLSMQLLTDSSQTCQQPALQGGEHRHDQSLPSSRNLLAPLYWWQTDHARAALVVTGTTTSCTVQAEPVEFCSDFSFVMMNPDAQRPWSCSSSPVQGAAFLPLAICLGHWDKWSGHPTSNWFHYQILGKSLWQLVPASTSNQVTLTSGSSTRP